MTFILHLRPRDSIFCKTRAASNEGDMSSESEARRISFETLHCAINRSQWMKYQAAMYVILTRGK